MCRRKRWFCIAIIGGNLPNPIIERPRRHRRAHTVELIRNLVTGFDVTHVVVEPNLAELVENLPVPTRLLTLDAARRHVVPDRRRISHRELAVRVLARIEGLRPFVTAKSGFLEVFDQWRRLPIMAAAMALTVLDELLNS